MRIAVLTLMFPALPETFIRREIVALQALGHELAVFVQRDVEGPLGVPVEGVPVARWDEAGVRAFSPDLLYGSLSVPAHRRTAVLSTQLDDLPYVLRVWSGLDTFQYPSPEIYRSIAGRDACRAVVVEDAYMVEYAAARMAVPMAKLHAIPNSLDLAQFTPRPAPSGTPVVLAIGRLVEKKGFVHLVRAMRQIPGAELWIVGDGPEADRLLREAIPAVKFLGYRPESDLPNLYAAAAVVVAPCVRTARGDADGIPTVVLEAMAMARPVIVSDLLSAPCYVRQGATGMLVPPGNERALSGAILGLLGARGKAEAMGARARAWAEEHLDIGRNARDLEAILLGASPAKAIA